jgi:rsbT antagonist protein RsbS
MSDFDSDAVTSVTQIDRYIIVTLGARISAGTVSEDFKIVLERAARGMEGIVLNYSLVTVIDSAVFTECRNITKTLALMGVPSVWVGLRPGVVCSLLDLGLTFENMSVRTARSLDDGIALLKKEHAERSRRIL